MNRLKLLALVAAPFLLGQAAFAQVAEPAAEEAPAVQDAGVAPEAPMAPEAPAPETPAPETLPPETPQPEAAPPPSAEAPPAVEPTATASATETGKIVFFRPGRLPGAIYTYHIVEVGDDGKPAKDAPELGDLPNGGAFEAQVPAGVHSFNITGPMAVNKAEDRLRMEVEPGETYYVEQTVRMGLVTGGFRLVPADEKRFVASKAKIKVAKK